MKLLLSLLAFIGMTGSYFCVMWGGYKLDRLGTIFGVVGIISYIVLLIS